MVYRRRNLFVIAVLLSACTPAPQEAASVTTDAAGAPSQNDAASSFDTTTTIEDLMSDTIAPNVELLWNAVSYIATAEGVTETMPQTDEDWATLRASANALIEAGEELMNTNREILTSEFDAATASFQLTPDEIKELLVDDPALWQQYAEQLQETTRMTLQAIEMRDVMGLQEFGAEINEACKGCHAAYWYRPSMPR